MLLSDGQIISVTLRASEMKSVRSQIVSLYNMCVLCVSLQPHSSDTF